jgi:GNAT superfamily N-acetyltransferase
MYRTLRTADRTPSALEVVDRPGLYVPRVVLRPLRPGEAEPIQQVFGGLSARSRRTRFLTAVPELTAGMLDRLVDVDHDRHGCWVAEVADRPVGIGRYVRTPEDPAVAEIALEIVDEYQGHGLGRLLLEVIGAAAADVGVTGLLWVMDPANQPIRHLAVPLGGRFTVEYGTLEGMTPLPAVAEVDACRIARVARAARERFAERRAA